MTAAAALAAFCTAMPSFSAFASSAAASAFAAAEKVERRIARKMLRVMKLPMMIVKGKMPSAKLPLAR